MKYLASGLGGFALATLLFVQFVIPEVRGNWRAQGRNEGGLAENVRMHRVAEKYFPSTPESCAHLETLGGAKPEAIEVVDCGSFRTLRVTK
jgi:hypothetical protein